MKRTPPTSLDKTKRSTVRPAEAAAMLGIAPATLYRWLKDLPDFPQPERYRLAGRNVTVWYVDDLEAWMVKQSDMAWRCNAPAEAVPLYDPEDIDAGRRALYCAYLLDLSVIEVFPLERDSGPAGTAHLFEYVSARVDKLISDAPTPDPKNTELTGYLRMLTHCDEVLSGRVKPEIRGPNGFTNPGNYRRGIYVSNEEAGE